MLIGSIRDRLESRCAAAAPQMTARHAPPGTLLAMLRRLCALLTLPSLLILLTVLALFVRSYWHLDEVGLMTRQHYWNIRSVEGRITTQRSWTAVPFWSPHVEYVGGELASLKYSNIRF